MRLHMLLRNSSWRASIALYLIGVVVFGQISATALAQEVTAAPAAQTTAPAPTAAAPAEAPTTSKKGQGHSSISKAYDSLQQITTAKAKKDFAVITPLQGQGHMTFGGEKEGTSWHILKIMGPDSKQFAYFVSALPKEQQKKFLIKFLQDWKKGISKKTTPVVDVEGNKKTIDTTALDLPASAEIAHLPLSQLQSYFQAWLAQTENRPFSFLSNNISKKIYEAGYPGITEKYVPNLYRKHTTFGSLIPAVYSGDFSMWVPHFGDAEKYIENITHTHIPGQWEVRFAIQNSFTEIEQAFQWYFQSLKEGEVAHTEKRGEKKEGQDNTFKYHPDLFAPGHFRIVFPKPALNEKEQAKYNKGFHNWIKGIQSLMIINGLAVKNNIESAAFKHIWNDEDLTKEKTGKGILRLEGDRWKAGTMGLEFRTNMQNEWMRKFIVEGLGPRLATNDWSGLLQKRDWKLIPPYLKSNVLLGSSLKRNILPGKNKKFQEAVAQIAQRFNVSVEEVQNFFTVVSESLSDKKYKALDGIAYLLHMKKYDKIRSVKSLVPLWNWENSPIVKPKKRALIVQQAQEFIKAVANLKEQENYPHIKNDISLLLQKWANSSRVANDLDEYLRAPVAPTEKRIARILNYPQDGSESVDVNNVHFGIEYTGHFPYREPGEYSERLGDGKKHRLISTTFVPHAERAAAMKKLAGTLYHILHEQEAQPAAGQKKFFRFTSEGAGGHGHGLSLNFNVRDPQNRKWRVEWDGVGRHYNKDGSVIPESLGRGHIEMVTPKFIPTAREILAVRKAMHLHGVHPFRTSGGGHVNVDLTPFDQRPAQMARFLRTFHHYRGVIATMFQNVLRINYAIPVPLTAELKKGLREVEATGNSVANETKLKQLMYNERYFNQHMARKSRYIQMDAITYFQDVIPERFIHDDFDIMNPAVWWRPQFRAEPKIRKMEFRLFNAPEDEVESALHIRLVKGMLHKALNTSTPFADLPEVDEDGKAIAERDHFYYAKHPKDAFSDLKAMCKDLGLNYKDFEFYMARSLNDIELTMKSDDFATWTDHGIQYLTYQDWGQALEVPRTAEEAVDCHTRQWIPNVTTPTTVREMFFQASRLGNLLVEKQLRKELEMKKALEEQSHLQSPLQLKKSEKQE